VFELEIYQDFSRTFFDNICA